MYVCLFLFVRPSVVVRRPSRRRRRRPLSVRPVRPSSSSIYNEMKEINAAKYNIFIHLHSLEAGQQNSVDLQGCGDVHGGGVGVVTAL